MYLVYAINIYDFFINFYILKSLFHLNLTCQKYLCSTWNLCGIHSSNYLIYMPKHIPYGIHMESMEYIHSTWSLYGMWGGGKVNNTGHICKV